MIGLDTNIVLRYLLQDEPSQASQVNRIVDDELNLQNPGFLSLPVILEIAWVLRSVFRLSRTEVVIHLEHLLAIESFNIQNEPEVFEAVYALKHGVAEFEDALIGALNKRAGCSVTYTFDRRALRLPHFGPIP